MPQGVLKIVAVSPGDVLEEVRAIKRVVESTNAGLARSLGIQLYLWRWDTDAYPALHPEGPQPVIDRLMGIEKSDLVVGVFWTRFGTPTTDSNSGTEHELNKAFSSSLQHGRPHVMIYFNEAPAHPTSTEETTQWGKVIDLKNRLSKIGLCWSYSGPRQFEEIFRDHLQRFLLDKEKSESARRYSVFDPPTFPDAIPRPALWKEIRAAFQKHSVIAIGGLSGSGKSYLTGSFIERKLKSAKYQRALWHDPTKGESLDRLLALLSAEFSLAGLSSISRCKALIAFLRDRKYLLVVENFHTVDQKTYSVLVELFTRAGLPCRLLLLTQTYVEPRATVPNIFHLTIPGFGLEQTRRLLLRRGLKNLSDDVLSKLVEETGGLPFAISLFAVLVGKQFDDPNELLAGTMARETRIQDWYSRVIDNIDTDIKQFLAYLSLTDGPFNKGVIRMLAAQFGIADSTRAFEQLLSHFLVGNHSPYRWKVHDLVAHLSSSSLDADARDKGHSALGRYLLSGLPRKRNHILSEEQFVWKERALRHLKRSKLERELADAVLDEMSGTAKARGHYALFLELSAEAANNEPAQNLWIKYHHAHCALILGNTSYCLRLIQPLLYNRAVIGDKTLHLAFTRLYAETLAEIRQEQVAIAALKPTIAAIETGTVSPVVLTQAKSVLVWLLTRTGEFFEALTLCDELLAEARQMDQRRSGAVAFTRKGVILLARESYNEASDLFTHAASLFREVGDRRGEGWSLSKLAECQLLVGEEATALRTFEDVKAIKSDIGECGTDYRDSLARMRAASRSPQLQKLLDQEIDRMNLFSRFT